MGEDILLVVELIGHVILAGSLLKDFMRPYYSAVGGTVALGQLNLSAKGFDGAPPLHTDALGHGELHFIAQSSAYHAQGYPRVARGGLQYGLAFGQLTRLDGFFYHVKRGAVLDRAAGIAALQLRHAPDPVIRVQVLQLYQRRIAYGIDYAHIVLATSATHCIILQWNMLQKHDRSTLITCPGCHLCS